MWTRLALLVFGATLGLLVAEGAGRILERMVCRDSLAGLVVRSREYGWGLRPGGAGWQQRCAVRAPEWRIYTRINPHGLRDRDVPYARQGGFRVLALGDSFIEGMQVEQERTFPKLLEQRLGAAAPGVPTEVLNAGVAGWGTDNALLFWRTEGWKYSPDLVLLGFDTTNDVFENQRHLVARSTFWPDKPYFTLERGQLTLQHFPLPARSPVMDALAGLSGPLLLHSALMRWTTALTSIWQLVSVPPPHPLEPGTPEPMEIYLRRYPPVWQQAWGITRRLILQLRREVRARGGRFAVVLIHPREEVSPMRFKFATAMRPSLKGAALDVDKPNRLITRFLARRHIPTIPTLDEFRARYAADGTPGYFTVDIHWAPAGHELVARLVDEGLHRLGLVPAR
jgi:hypothetical protein